MDNAVRYDPDAADFTEHASLLAERVKHHLQAARMEYVEPVGVLAVTHQEIRDIGRQRQNMASLNLSNGWVLMRSWTVQACSVNTASGRIPCVGGHVLGSSLSDPVNSRFFDYPGMSAVHFNLAD